MTALQDRVALVTGSSSGLGLAAARALVDLGARVALNSRGGKKLESAHRSLSAGGGEVVAIPADIRQPDELENLVSEVEEHLGPVDILVSNGGGPRVSQQSNWTRPIGRRPCPWPFCSCPGSAGWSCRG